MSGMPSGTVMVPPAGSEQDPARHDDPAAARPTRATEPAGRWRPALVAALPAWVASRFIVIGGYVLARVTVDQLHVVRPAPLRDGLGAWDAAQYWAIADHGYAAAVNGQRFFPLFPLLVRAVSPVVSGHTAVAGMVVANVAALVAGAALYRLVVFDTGDSRAATLATWLLLAGAGAAPLVMGYAESVGTAAAVLAFLAARQGRWWWAAVAGAAVGLTWSVGFLLALPLAVEAARGFTAAPVRERVGRVTAAAMPVLAGVTYLAWVQRTTGRWWGRVYGVQVDVYHRHVQDPVSRIGRVAYDLVAGHHASGIYLPWILLALLLLTVSARRLPASYTLYALVILIVVISSDNIDSFERYILRAFPLVVAAALVIRRERDRLLVVAFGAAGLLAYSTAIFLGAKVP